MHTTRPQLPPTSRCKANMWATPGRAPRRPFALGGSAQSERLAGAAGKCCSLAALPKGAPAPSGRAASSPLQGQTSPNDRGATSPCAGKWHLANHGNPNGREGACATNSGYETLPKQGETPRAPSNSSQNGGGGHQSLKMDAAEASLSQPSSPQALLMPAAFQHQTSVQPFP